MYNSSLTYQYILQVKTDGVISLDSLYTPYIVNPFPLRLSYMIAPFWDNVDTRGTGKIFYRQTTDPTLLAKASIQIQAANLSVFQNITNLLIATWDAVGYYPRKTDKVRHHFCQ